MPSKKHEVALWEPSPFEGTDLLPTAAGSAAQLVSDDQGEIPVVGRENLEPEDLVLPVLSLLHGNSDPVQKHHEDQDGNQAVPGKFYLSSNGYVLKPPLRVLVVQYHKSRALFPKAKDPDQRGLERCLSRDGMMGTKYGSCAGCAYTKWRAEKTRPICDLQHTYVVITQHGPAMIRFSGASAPGGKMFINKWGHSSLNLWHHPAKVSVSHGERVEDGEKLPYLKMEMNWVLAENVPPNVHRMAYDTHTQINEAFEQGRLDSASHEATE